jgi:HAD superfamily hydrolase (TIGR01490 family)
MRKLALFDIDKTIYNGYTIFDLAEFQVQNGLVEPKLLEVLDSDTADYKSQKLNYEEYVKVLNEHWISFLKGKKYLDIFNNAFEFFSLNNHKFYNFVEPLFEQLKDSHDIFLVTGEMTFIGDSVRKIFNTTGYRATEIEVIDGVISGRIMNYLATREEKKHAISDLLQRYRIDGSIAFGDSVGDIEMLSVVEKAFCVNASPELIDVVSERGWIRCDSVNILEILHNQKII